MSGSAFKSAAGGNARVQVRLRLPQEPEPLDDAVERLGSRRLTSIRGDDNFALAYRARVVNFVGENYNAFVGDTFSKGRLTVNGGIRWDQQNAANEASTAPANTMFPDLLPSLSFDGGGPTITWNDISPRVGVTYALDEKRKTVARASYARYAGQLNPFEVTSASPVGGYYTFIAYKWVDTNHDGFAQKNEILTNLGPQYSNDVDPAHPTSASSPNTIDPNYHANRDNEFIVGLDHELMPNFAVGAAYTFRRTNDWPTWNPRIGMTSADYTVVATAVRAAATARSSTRRIRRRSTRRGGGRILDQPARLPSHLQGLEFTLNKRLSNKWMARVAFSFNDWREHIDGPGAVQNPTRTDSTTGGAGAGTLSGPHSRRRPDRAALGRLGQGRHLLQRAVAVERQRVLPARRRVRRRREPLRPPGLRRAAASSSSAPAATAPSARWPRRRSTTCAIRTCGTSTCASPRSIKIQRVNFLLSADLFNVLNAGTMLAQNRNLLVRRVRHDQRDHQPAHPARRREVPVLGRFR